MRKDMLPPSTRLAVTLGISALASALASCGGEGASKAISVVPGATASATSTTGASTTPAAAATSTPGSTTAAAPADLEYYKIGQLTWSLDTEVSEDIRARITDAMNWTINHTNTLAGYTGNVSVTYHVGTPTAEADYRWRIQFGGSIGRRVALHELAHWLGSGTYGEWDRYMVDGRWTGAVTDARIKAFDGPAAVQWGDRIHFWPYGLNYDDEFFETQRNVQLVSSQLSDMGLGDAAAQFAGNRRFANRSSKLLMDGVGASPIANSGSAATLVWNVRYVDGYIELVSADGRAIDSLGNTNNGDPTALAPRSQGNGQQWEVLPTDDGWFQLRNRQTSKCLDNAGNLSTGAPIRVWDCEGRPNQQWHLVR
ncbi:RICIN domain-containing protein [Sphingomonas sp. Xoc002]|uniref:RICIN domain-containing protein n=1 Tax=Sphingomonas sp. Xoc002 TaxID=2837624 RepID=UPI003D177FAB